MNDDTSSFPAQIVITVIGPGEISSWLRPLVKALKTGMPDLYISAVLFPSVFRAGTEMEILKTMEGLDAAASVRQAYRMIFLGKFPNGFRRGSEVPGCLLHLGGEPLLTRLLAWRMKLIPVFYGEGVPHPRSVFTRIFLSGNSIPSHVRGNPKIIAVGNMMVDASEMMCSGRSAEKSNKLSIGLFPGSRLYQVREMIPFLIRVAGLAAKEMKDIRWMIAKSEYLTMADIEKSAAALDNKVLEGEPAVMDKASPSPILISGTGIHLEIHAPGSVMSRADLALTIPGTNTAELASLGIPMIVLLPSQKSEMYPIPGPATHLNRIPLVGKYLKRWILNLFRRKVKYFAYPNRKAGFSLVPEIVGPITPDLVAAELVKYSGLPLDEVSARLRSVMGEPGASQRLAEEIQALIYRNNPLG